MMKGTEALGQLFSKSEIEEAVKDLGTYEKPQDRRPQDHWTLLGAKMAEERKELNFDK